MDYHHSTLHEAATPSNQTEALNLTSFLPQDTLMKVFEEEIDAWHARRILSLTRVHSWLSLIAREWLREGTNEFAGGGNVIQKGTSITVELAPEVKATASRSLAA